MSSTLKILAVDDEPGMRMGVERALRNFMVNLPEVDGEILFQIETAATGEEALEKVESYKPDLMLLDYKLPGISGLDVLAKLHDDQSETLVIMVTAYASLETAVTATKSGAFDFLAKPFTPGELKSTVSKGTKHIMLQREAKRLADEKHQVRFHFISVVAHELKSPLAAIEGYLNLMREPDMKTDPEAVDKMVDRSLIRIQGMRKLILDLIDLTRIESGAKARDMQDINISEIAKLSIDTMFLDAKAREISINLHAPEQLIMKADRGELEIIFNNLVSNAVKYNRDKGQVDVDLEVKGPLVQIRVADTGIGMSKEECDKLFNDFVRIKNAKTRKIPGSGLGLSILKKLALLYNGDVRVESVADQGTTFYVTLQQFSETKK